MDSKTQVKASVIAVASGATVDETALAEIMKAFHAQFAGRGLRVVQVFYADDQGGTDRLTVLDYTYAYKYYHGIEHSILTDVGHRVFGPLHSQDPLFLLLDRTSIVRFRQEGVIPDRTRLEAYIEQLLR